MLQPLFSPDQFSYTITDVEGGVNIDLTYKVTGQVKTFFQAGTNLRHESFESHMNSLTDELMLGWFVRPGRKSKKDK